MSQQKLKFEEQQLRREQAKATKSIKHATLIGHIGLTYDHEIDAPSSDPSAQSQTSGFGDHILTLNENSDQYKDSKWCFDTPGVIQRDQVSLQMISIQHFDHVLIFRFFIF